MTSEGPRLAATQHPLTSRSGAPTRAVVVASTGARPRLSACIAALLPRCLRAGAELIVVRGETRPALHELSLAHPNVRVVPAPPGSDTFALRDVGVSETRADIVTLVNDVDDHALSCAVPDGSPRGDRRAQAASMHAPRLSVIVPVYRDGAVLAESLEAIAESDLPREQWELIVVDDASTDGTAQVASRWADLVVRLPGSRHGPAYARNRGFEVARGQYMAFIDPDVRVRADTLRRFASILDDDPAVSAVFGSLDAEPVTRGLVSQYRNLLTCYYHQRTPGVAETFWASCGAIRRSAFADAGMFDEWHFPRRQVEDSELGQRLRQRGHTIILRPEIQATPLRPWTLRRMIAADLHDRTVPWMRTIDPHREAREKAAHRPRRAKRWNTVLTWTALALAIAALVADVRSPLFAAGLCLVAVLFNNREQYRFLADQRSAKLALFVVPLDLLSYLVNGVAVGYGLLLREVIGPPPPAPTVEAYAEVGLKMWPPVPSRRADAPADSD